MNDHMNDDIHDLDAAYALDALDAEERSAFEAHYADCPRCATSVGEFREVAARLGTLTSTAPPASLRGSILDRIADTPQLPARTEVADLGAARDRRRRSAALIGGLSAAAAAVVIVGALVLVRGGSSGSAVDDVIAAPDARITTLQGDQGGQGVIRVAWSADRDELAVIGSGLAAAPPGSTYQLWFVLVDGVASAGTFRPDGSGSVSEVLEVDDLDSAGWGVTIEPDGGSEQPTSDIVFVAELT